MRSPGPYTVTVRVSSALRGVPSGSETSAVSVIVATARPSSAMPVTDAAEPRRLWLANQ